MKALSLNRWLRARLEHKDLGWREIGETFIRFVLLRTRWFNLYLHFLDAPNENPKGCHDHPWSFLTLILWGGYLEYADGVYRRRRAGRILYRRAEFSHSITTPYGPSWSLVLVGKRRRVWRFNTCGEA
jgi:hypothetical protein